MYFFYIFRSVVGRSAFVADHGDCTNSIVYMLKLIPAERTE